MSDSVRPHRRRPTGSPIPGILQARTLEWVAISFSNAWNWKVKVKSLNCVRLLATPCTAAYQAPPSMGFARQEYWNGLPLPSLYDMSSHGFFVFFPFGLLWDSWISRFLSFAKYGKFSVIIFSSIFFLPCIFFLFFWDLNDMNVKTSWYNLTGPWGPVEKIFFYVVQIE